MVAQITKAAFLGFTSLHWASQYFQRDLRAVEVTLVWCVLRVYGVGPSEAGVSLHLSVMYIPLRGLCSHRPAGPPQGARMLSRGVRATFSL